MVYSDFDLKRAVTELGLTRGTDVNLFPDVSPIEPSDYLRAWLDEFGPPALALGTESGRREVLIFPILAEAKRRSPPPLTIASGVTFDVDKARGLTRLCDFILTRSRERFYIIAPAFAVVEAKKEDLTPGLGQCAAEMVAVKVFNDREGRSVPTVYGCVTNGSSWVFLKLHETALWIDAVEYTLAQLPTILGILVRIASE